MSQVEELDDSQAYRTALGIAKLTVSIAAINSKQQWRGLIQCIQWQHRSLD